MTALQSLTNSARAIAVLATLFALFVGFLVLGKGYSLKEMDWNSDGSTSISEMLDAINIDRRPVVQDGVTCDEYFRLKDDLAVLVDCPAQHQPSTG